MENFPRKVTGQKVLTPQKFVSKLPPSSVLLALADTIFTVANGINSNGALICRGRVPTTHNDFHTNLHTANLNPFHTDSANPDLRHKSNQKIAPQLQSVKQNLSADFRAIPPYTTGNNQYHNYGVLSPPCTSGGLRQFSAQKHIDCCLVHCPSNVNQNYTVEPLYKGHSE